MKLSSFITIAIKSVLAPIFAMYLLSEYNFCDYLLFIPDDYRFESGVTLYLAIILLIIDGVLAYINSSKAQIKCVFYSDSSNESIVNKPEIVLRDNQLGVSSIYCHLIIEGNYKTLKETSIDMEIPSWFQMQSNEKDCIKQKGDTITWDISKLLPTKDPTHDVFIESRDKLLFIKNHNNNTFISLKPTIRKNCKSRSINFNTNGFILRNEGT